MVENPEMQGSLTAVLGSQGTTETLWDMGRIADVILTQYWDVLH